MAFDSILNGERMEATNVQQILDALSGTSGGGQQILFNQYSNSSNYAVTVRNLDTTNGYGLKVTDAADSALLQVYKNTIVLGASAASDALTINCNISGKVYIGDSANAKMTTGLTINQSTADNEILTFKSGDVGHLDTDETEADTFGFFIKAEAAAGGLQINGLKDANDAVSGGALVLNGKLGEAADTTQTAAGRAVVEVVAQVADGATGMTSVAATGNCFAVRNHTNTVFIVDGAGDILYDGSAAAFDQHEDALLAHDLAKIVAGNDKHVQQYDRAAMVGLGIIREDKNGKVFVSQKARTAVTEGAIGQLFFYIKTLEQKVAKLSDQLAGKP